MTKSLKKPLLLSIIFVLLIHLEPFWERYPGGWWNMLIYLAIAVLFFWILVKIILEIIKIIKFRKTFKYNALIPILILSFAIFEGLFNPLNIHAEKLFGKVVFTACYEGTQNQATFNLRKNGHFDIHWTGVFFYDEFFTGKYKKNNDTIFMKFRGKAPRNLGDTLIVKDDNIFLITDDSIKPTFFYLGKCKGLN
jgi:hypothetical protein